LLVIDFLPAIVLSLPRDKAHRAYFAHGARSAEVSLWLNCSLKHISPTGDFGKTLGAAPFFVWTDLDTTELFKGEIVTLNADIRKRTTKREAVRFTEIWIKISTDSMKQVELDNALNGLRVELIFHGNSHYMLNSKVYLISTEKQILTFDYKLIDGKPGHPNEVYRKIASSDVGLSPYGLWSLSLPCLNLLRTNVTKCSSDSLKPFIGLKVNVAMVGVGKHVVKSVQGQALPELYLERYYDVVN